jgi:Enoyl-(Acyl carrier protein) reductase
MIAPRADVSSPKEVDRAASAVLDHYGRVDVLINSAGVFPHSTFANMTLAQWRRVIDVAQCFQPVLGNSPLTSGPRLLPWTATPSIVAPAAGALSDRIGPHPIMVTGMLLQTGGLGWFALEVTGSVSYGALVAPLIIAGVGISMALPTTPAGALCAVAHSNLGKAWAPTTRRSASAACSASRWRPRYSRPTAISPRLPRSTAASARRSRSPRAFRCSDRWPRYSSPRAEAPPRRLQPSWPPGPAVAS